MNDFAARTYYKLIMTLASPLTVGSGNNINTDHDVIIDAQGKPFIPASTIAGVLRSYYPEEEGNRLFGYIRTDKGDKTEEKVSSIAVYDAYLESGCDACFITTRDSVKLFEKVAVKGAKFDQEAVETGAVFVSYLELFDREYESRVEEALSAMDCGVLRLGMKTTRGYGQVSLKVAKKRIDSFDDYLAFDMMDEWQGAEELALTAFPTGRQLRLSVECAGGISIREYSTDINMPDYKQLALHNEDNTPVIPGTSWAGAFRERFASFAGAQAAKELFGIVDEKTKETRKSRVLFSETQLSGGTYKDVTRNAIDRFSAATKDGALYKERTYYNGKGDLVITFTNASEPYDISAFAACVADLSNGLMSVGGLASVGRGIFAVRAVNGKTVQEESDLFEMVTEALK